mmetsp:Transcript_8678/g.30911  ORF Transcript_8678/g.30911 Transcript_8678/m.30911 type:complete len:82 (-) Transcript_8678:563-808(-)
MDHPMPMTRNAETHAAARDTHQFIAVRTRSCMDPRDSIAETDGKATPHTLRAHIQRGSPQQEDTRSTSIRSQVSFTGRIAW